MEKTREQIASENDAFRKKIITHYQSFLRLTETPAAVFSGINIGGRLVMTDGVGALQLEDQYALLDLVKEHTNFDRDNPYRERDFGKVSLRSKDYFFKIDYYDEKFEQFCNPETDNPVRVMTVMEASEY